MFPTPNPRNGLILSPVHQVTILHVPKSCSRGVMATRLTSNQKILGSTPSVSVFVNFSFSLSMFRLLIWSVLSKQLHTLSINSLY